MTDFDEIKMILQDQSDILLDLLGKIERLVAAIEVIAHSIPIKMINDPDSEVQ